VPKQGLGEEDNQRWIYVSSVTPFRLSITYVS
jgi:hypothetical protein